MNPYPRALNQRSMRKLLEANGWVATVGGKHVVKMEKPGRRPITLPANKRRDYRQDCGWRYSGKRVSLARRSHDADGRGPR